MAQHDYIISNQTFPNTRADINNLASAIATNNSGTSAPSTQYAGQFWIDTTSTTWTLYIHDGTDDIQFATIDTSANTVNFTDSALDVVTDTTPQLGGDLDLNSNDITGTGNINITGNITTSGNLVVDTNTLFVDSVNNIVRIGDNHSYSANTSADELIVGNTTSGSKTGITILSSNDAAFSRGSIYFADSSADSIGRIEYNHGTSDTDVMKFFTNTAEAMRIDSSGNVLVGKTSDSFADVGVVLSDSQANSFTRNGANVISVRRNTSDGDIVSFYKDTTKVGSILTRSSNLTIGSSDTGLEFNQANDIIFPANPSTNNTRDNAIDLGSGEARFKDGYFGGTVTATAFSGDGSALTGVGGGGKILQVVSTSTNAMTSHSRGDEMTNFLTTITPSSTSSKILCIVSLGLVGSDASADTGIDIRRKIGAGSFSSLQIGTGASNTNTTFVPFMGYGGGLATGGVGFQIVDSPNTTSAVSYQLQCRINTGRTMYINRRNGTDYGTSSGITLLEIAG